MVDHVVVGAGSAGCAIATRLSEDPSTSVLLLEAGPDHRVREIGIPAAFPRLFHTERDWDYKTVPQPELGGRALYWPRGRTLGGSSSLNAMMWVRGNPADYDAWVEFGGEGWGYEAVLPHFRRIEDVERPGGGAHAGRDGPLRVSEQRDPNPATELFVEACVNAGIPRNPNANAGRNDGVDLTQVSQHRGMRVSAATAYLDPASGRSNLTVLTDALATRVLIENGRATGVEYLHDGHTRRTRVSGEVVLAGGAVNSPQLLMLSGVGDADHLRGVGVEPLVDLPGVGENLMDHLTCGVIRRTDRSDTLYAAETPRQLVRYLLLRRGLLTSNIGEAHAFIRTEDGLKGPDIELIFAPVEYLDHGDTRQDGHGYTIAVVLLQPHSRGRIRLASPDPRDHPLIDPRYLSSDRDVAVLIAGMRRAMEVFDTEPLARHVRGWVRPDRPPTTQQDIEAAVRGWSETLYHPAGTCRMGTDADAVVDGDLRVHGVAGLRVADASVMPTLIRGHTNAPAIMIGERAAALIAGS